MGTKIFHWRQTWTVSGQMVTNLKLTWRVEKNQIMLKIWKHNYTLSMVIHICRAKEDNLCHLNWLNTMWIVQRLPLLMSTLHVYLPTSIPIWLERIASNIVCSIKSFSGINDVDTQDPRIRLLSILFTSDEKIEKQYLQ